MLPMFRPFLVSALGAAILCLSSCGETRKPAAIAAPAAAAPAVKAAYECPMGCAGSQSSKPGKCPTCEMELVKKS
ncbi:heavy metal-binding domain-containing protein [Hymenobacter terricola]|uniref:heavy metal-binding domain-containing protein n=1 Tax=Hymenobacter terricola TaxID=2819236 RepID=UPI001B3028A3|nr:heavy metal-binding domain-containing protein [Hymenobacter terricola]